MKGNASTSLMKVLIKGTSSSTAPSPQQQSRLGSSSGDQMLNSMTRSPRMTSPSSSSNNNVGGGQQQQQRIKRTPSLVGGSNKASTLKSQSSEDATNMMIDSFDSTCSSSGSDVNMSSIGTKFALTMLGLNNPNRLNKNIIQKVKYRFLN